MGNTRKSEVHTVQTASGEKEKLEIKGAKHMQSDLLETERYWKTVQEFTGKYTL